MERAVEGTAEVGTLGSRIAVVGTTGSGKTTLARELARRLGFDHIELDALNWEPGWQQAANDVFVERVRTAAERPRWVSDGNYSRACPVLWAHADTIVWLDYALPVIMWRLLRRTLRRIVTRQELWGGNRESFRTQFLSRDSLLLWALQTYRRRRREYPRRSPVRPPGGGRACTGTCSGWRRCSGRALR